MKRARACDGTREIVRLNVGGRLFQTTPETLSRSPFFAPLLIGAVASHCVVEMRVDAMLNELHGGGGRGFARRGFTAQETEFEIESVTLIN